ncbi:hypothetical protein ScPMuIL_006431 [Solemya velum]
MATRRREGARIFFIYDHKVLKREEDDLKDAILYFVPHTKSVDDQCQLCGQLMGMSEFLCSTISQSSPAGLQATHTKVLEGKLDSPDGLTVQQLDSLHRTFVTFYGSLDWIKKRNQKSHNLFLADLQATMDTLLPFSNHYGDQLALAFNILPTIDLPKSSAFVFLQASHVLQSSQRRPGVLGGAVFYKNRVLSTQLSPLLTKRLLFVQTKISDLLNIRTTFAKPLPRGVSLIRVFIDIDDYSQIQSRNKCLYRHKRTSDFHSQMCEDEMYQLENQSVIRLNSRNKSECTEENMSDSIHAFSDRSSPPISHNKNTKVQPMTSSPIVDKWGKNEAVMKKEHFLTRNISEHVSDCDESRIVNEKTLHNLSLNSVNSKKGSRSNTENHKRNKTSSEEGKSWNSVKPVHHTGNDLNPNRNSSSTKLRNKNPEKSLKERKKDKKMGGSETISDLEDNNLKKTKISKTEEKIETISKIEDGVNKDGEIETISDLEDSSMMLGSDKSSMWSMRRNKDTGSLKMETLSKPKGKLIERMTQSEGEISVDMDRAIGDIVVEYGRDSPKTLAVMLKKYPDKSSDRYITLDSEDISVKTHDSRKDSSENHLEDIVRNEVKSKLKTEVIYDKNSNSEVDLGVKGVSRYVENTMSEDSSEHLEESREMFEPKVSVTESAVDAGRGCEVNKVDIVHPYNDDIKLELASERISSEDNSQVVDVSNGCETGKIDTVFLPNNEASNTKQDLRSEENSSAGVHTEMGKVAGENNHNGIVFLSDSNSELSEETGLARTDDDCEHTHKIFNLSIEKNHNLCDKSSSLILEESCKSQENLSLKEKNESKYLSESSHDNYNNRSCSTPGEDDVSILRMAQDENGTDVDSVFLQRLSSSEMAVDPDCDCHFGSDIKSCVGDEHVSECHNACTEENIQMDLSGNDKTGDIDMTTEGTNGDELKTRICINNELKGQLVERIEVDVNTSLQFNHMKQDIENSQNEIVSEPQREEWNKSKCEVEHPIPLTQNKIEIENNSTAHNKKFCDETSIVSEVQDLVHTEKDDEHEVNGLQEQNEIYLESQGKNSESSSVKNSYEHGEQSNKSNEGEKNEVNNENVSEHCYNKNSGQSDENTDFQQTIESQCLDHGKNAEMEGTFLPSPEVNSDHLICDLEVSALHVANRPSRKLSDSQSGMDDHEVQSNVKNEIGGDGLQSNEDGSASDVDVYGKKRNLSSVLSDEFSSGDMTTKEHFTFSSNPDAGLSDTSGMSGKQHMRVQEASDQNTLTAASQAAASCSDQNAAVTASYKPQMDSDSDCDAWSPSKEGLARLTLYVQGHSNMLLLLLMEEDANQDENTLKALWKNALTSLADLESHIYNSLEEVKEKDQQKLYKYLKYDSFSHSLKGNVLKPSNGSENAFCEVTVEMHNDLGNTDSISDIILASHQNSCYSHQSLDGEVYFQMNQPLEVKSGLPSRGDLNISMDQKAQQYLAADQNILLL